jgi:hypothetical protein
MAANERKRIQKKVNKVTPEQMKEKIAMAKYIATGNAYQVKVNRAKGKLDTLDFRAAKTPKQITKDLNSMNSSAKTAGRAKNVELKLKKAAAAKKPGKK